MRKQLWIGVSCLVGCVAQGGKVPVPDISDDGSTGGGEETPPGSVSGAEGGSTSGGSAPTDASMTGPEQSTSGTGTPPDDTESDGGSTSGEAPLVPTIPADTVLLVQFDDAVIGSYEVDAWAEDWHNPAWENGVSEGHLEIIEDGHSGRGMRVHHPADAFGPDTGAQWHLDFDESYDALYLGFWVRFGADFDFVLGGKLVGLTGGAVHHAGSTPNGSDGWNYRGFWRESGIAGAQIYHVDQAEQYGDQPDWALPSTQTFEPGVWHHVQHRVVMNTPGAADGSLECWLDGELALQATELRFRDQDALAIDALRFSNFFGGGDSSYNTTKPEYVDFDDFVVSTEPILVDAE